VRDFSEEGLRDKEALLDKITKDVMRDFPRSSCEIKIEQQYRNMKVVLDKHPQITANALEGSAARGLRRSGRACAGARMARDCHSWASPALTSSPASTRFTRGSNG
jgi:tripeptide aminopeptidase